jgi:glutaredoxin/glutathione-dependent peroxiredoxin
MTIAVGDRLPEATLLEAVEGGSAPVTTGALCEGRRIVLFGLPGAYTGTCSTRHVPSFIAVMDGLRAKGVEDVVCVSVNDPFVMKAWGEATGATAAGIRMVGDAESRFTEALGLAFSNPERGLIGRSKRYAMLVENGVVKVCNVEASPGECDLSAGQAMLDAV